MLEKKLRPLLKKINVGIRISNKILIWIESELFFLPLYIMVGKSSAQIERLFYQMFANCCDETLPALSHLDCQSDGKRTPLRDRDRLANGPQWVPGFLSSSFGLFPERLRNKSELVGSEEIHQAYTKHPKYVTPSGWILLKVFLLLSLWSLQKPGRCNLKPFLDQVRLLTDVFLLFLKFAMILREKFCQLWRLNWSFIFITKELISSYYEEKVSMNTHSQGFQQNEYNTERPQIYIIFIVFSFLLFIPSPWRET